MSGWNGGPHPNRKLSDDQVREVFALRVEGLSRNEISKRIGAGERTVHDILSRRIYKDVQVSYEGELIKRVSQKGRPSPQRSLTDDQVRAIRRLAREGVTQERIAETVGATKSVVGDVVRRQKYKNVPDSTDTPAES